MKIAFRHVANFSAIAFAILAVVWMFSPAQSLAFWGVGYNAEAGLVSRRAASLYAGIAVMFHMVRKAGPSAGRRAIVLGVLVACLLLSALGLIEFAFGHAHRGILVAVSLEVFVSLALLFVGGMRTTDGIQQP